MNVFMNYKFCTKNMTLDENNDNDNDNENENDNDNENENKQKKNFFNNI